MDTTLSSKSAQAAPAHTILNTASRVLMWAALIVLCFHLIVYMVYATNLIQFPFDYDQGEGFELVDTILFSQGRFPYLDTDVYPFYSSNYPPLFHVMAAPFVWLFGPAYWYGRLLGFLGTLITASAIALAVYRDGGRHRWIALLSGLAFLASNTVYHIGPLFRQHMTMVMFEMLAVLVLANANEIPDQGKRRRTIAVGLALILAAGFTKQLALASAVGIFVFLFIRQPRRALVSGVVFSIAGIALFAWMTIATNGQWWVQTISANINDYYPDQTAGLFRLWFGLHGFLIVPALLYAAYELYFSRLSIYTIWFVAAVANSVLSGKWGAGDSYFATAIAATCVLSGLFASRWLNRRWDFPVNYLSRIVIFPLRRLAPLVSRAALVAVPLMYLGYGAATLKMPTTLPVFSTIAQILNVQPNALNGFYDSAGRIAGGYADIGHLTTEADIEAGWRIVERVRAAQGPVLSEEAAFSLLAGRDVITNPTQLLNLYLNNAWDSTGLVAMINNREFALIIFRAQFYPDPVLRAVAANYRHTETILMNGFEYLLLTPLAED
jgi:4-amino-4-deoxy-L-arabinose transferase-like glycosyltransferase